MARIAKKKNVDNGLAYEFSIQEKDIIERENFGAFEIIKTKKGIMYKNYTGYHVWFTPYCTGADGVAHETSSYLWLDELLRHKKEFAGHESDPYLDTEITQGEILETDKIITEACLTHPMTAFIDLDYATKFASEHIKWLSEMSAKLESAMDNTPEDEDLDAVKANLEHDTKVIAMENLSNELNSK